MSSARPLVRDRYSFGNLEEVLPLPHLIDIQRKSFEWFSAEGVADTFRDLSPITDFSETLSLELEFDPTDDVGDEERRQILFFNDGDEV